MDPKRKTNSLPIQCWMMKSFLKNQFRKLVRVNPSEPLKPELISKFCQSEAWLQKKKKKKKKPTKKP
jgi:hypothetical protein